MYHLDVWEKGKGNAATSNEKDLKRNITPKKTNPTCTIRNGIPYSRRNGDPQECTELKCCSECQQAGTGPSRRHIQGSKIAKRLPSVKYSFKVLENRKLYEKNFRKNYILKKWTKWRAGARWREPLAR